MEKNGTFMEELERERKTAALSKMPGEKKQLNDHGDASKAYANYGNLLHEPRRVEDSLRFLIKQKRWD